MDVVCKLLEKVELVIQRIGNHAFWHPVAVICLDGARNLPCLPQFASGLHPHHLTIHDILHGGNQAHTMLQIGNAKRVSYKGNISAAYDIPPPIASMDASSSAYKEQVDDVLAYSAGLTDVQKLQVRPTLLSLSLSRAL